MALQRYSMRNKYRIRFPKGKSGLLLFTKEKRAANQYEVANALQSCSADVSIAHA